MHIYELNGDNLNLVQELTHLGPVTDVSYSPDDKYLVACDANRKVILYETEEYKVIIIIGIAEHQSYLYRVSQDKKNRSI